jgi:hypothetical protein
VYHNWEPLAGPAGPVEAVMVLAAVEAMALET